MSSPEINSRIDGSSMVSEKAHFFDSHSRGEEKSRGEVRLVGM